MTLEDTANSEPVYVGHRKITRDDKEYALRLSRIFDDMLGLEVSNPSPEQSLNQELSRYKTAILRNIK